MSRPHALPLLAGLLLIGACAAPEEQAERARAAIGQSIAQGDRAGALLAIEELREVGGDDADAQLEVAGLMVRAGNAPDAVWLLEALNRREPERGDVALALAGAALMTGNPARAREVAGTIAPDAEQHADALVLRAQAELQLGDLEAALATLEQAEERYPERPEARLVRISALLSEHRRDEARAAVEGARADLDGDDEHTRALRRRLDLTLAQIQAEQGETEAALAGLEALLTDDPRDLLVWQALVHVLSKAKRGDEALARIERERVQEGAPPQLEALAAQLLQAQGDDAAAEAALQRYAERSDSAAAALPLMTFHSERGDAAATLRVLDAALERFPEEATLRLHRSEALLAEGRVDEARVEIARLRSATFAGDPQIEYLEARVALAEGDARGAGERLIALAPRLDRASTQFWIGRALEDSGDLEGARRRYGLARARDPAWLAPSAAAIALEQRAGRWREVMTLARSLLARAPYEFSAWGALVVALENVGEGASAESVARQCLERFPDRSEAHLLLARALRAQGRMDEALAELDAADAVERTPAVAAARVRTLGMAGRLPEGIALGREAIAAYPGAAEPHAALAAVFFAAGAADDGARMTDRALALDPIQVRPLRVRCEFRAASADWTGARSDCTRYVKRRSSDALAYFLLGLAEAGLGQNEAAEAAYRRAAELDERDPRPHNNLADLLARQGDLDSALLAAQEAYRLDATNPHVLDTLGALYLEKGLVKRAVAVLEEANAAGPELPGIQLNLALAYRQAGRPEAAEPLLAAVAASPLARPEQRARAQEALDSVP